MASANGEDEKENGTVGNPVPGMWTVTPSRVAPDLYRIAFNTRGRLFFVTSIPMHVLDDGAVKIGPVDFTDKPADALYMAKDLAVEVMKHQSKSHSCHLWSGPTIKTKYVRAN